MIPSRPLPETSSKPGGIGAVIGWRFYGLPPKICCPGNALCANCPILFKVTLAICDLPMRDPGGIDSMPPLASRIIDTIDVIRRSLSGLRLGLLLEALMVHNCNLPVLDLDKALGAKAGKIP